MSLKKVGSFRQTAAWELYSLSKTERSPWDYNTDTWTGPLVFILTCF